jgi:DNA-binding NtrC family response regulator
VFEEAHGGTVYFDELANMPLDIQAKLLRAVQEKEIRRIGATKTIPLEFRVICATNQRLEALVRQGRFKEDLYQRLSVLPLELPPLRERAEDVPLLAEHFLAQQSAGKRFTEAALQLLTRYAWPGNVRELANLVSYVVAMTDGDEIDLSDLPPKLRDSAGAASGSGTGFYDAVEAFEKKLLEDEFRGFQGGIGDLALRLGMGRSHLYSKLKKYGIHG